MIECLKCAYCQKTIQQKPGRGRNRTCCTLHCYRLKNKEKIKLYNKKYRSSHRILPEKIISECLSCSKIIDNKRSGVKFCSKYCWRKDWAKKNSEKVRLSQRKYVMNKKKRGKMKYLNTRAFFDNELYELIETKDLRVLLEFTKYQKNSTLNTYWVPVQTEFNFGDEE